MSQKSSNQKKGQSSSGGQKGKRKERYLLTGCIEIGRASCRERVFTGV